MVFERDLTESIVKTLNYFDIFSYPLTKEELFYYLWQPPSGVNYITFVAFLDDHKGNNRWEEKWGFFYLKGKEENVEKRRERQLESILKLKVATRAAKKLRNIPFLKAIFVCNTVAANQANEDSDIDFFIVSAKNRLWIVRFFANLILRLWGLRTYGHKMRNRICLSFFVDEDNLDLKPLSVSNPDIHFIYWLIQMIPLFDLNQIATKFKTHNRWVAEYIPNYFDRPVAKFLNEVKVNSLSKIWRRFWEIAWQGSYGEYVESETYKLQLLKLPLAVKDAAEKGDKGVVISKGVIKLHEEDSRKRILNQWLETLTTLNKEEYVE